MRRKTFDLILTMGGAGLVVVLLAAGALGLWAVNWTNTNVHNQLAAQKIQFPPAAALATAKNPPPGGFSEITPAMVPYLKPYAGQWVTTGPQAETYADHFIYNHLQQIGGGLTYSQLSAKAMALTPGSAAYTAAESTVETVFKGTTLRGLLLEAYGFWTLGEVALWASIVAFILAGIMALLSVLGFAHWRRTSEDQEFPKPHRNGLAETKAEGKELAGV